MKRSGQILLELLVAGILLILIVPRVGPLCWKYAGPNWREYSLLVESNRAQVAINASRQALAEIKAHTASVIASTKRRERDIEHQQAMKLYDAFTDRQANLYAKCLTEARGKIAETAKDAMIFKIWMSDYGVQDCAAVGEVKLIAAR